MQKTKGFITIATGQDEYYILAKNLLQSYHYFCKQPYPFALLCDRINKHTDGFDDVIIYRDGASKSYLDKLYLAEYAPYDETIFIDADCLAYGNLNVLFNYFAQADDFSCFGRVLSLDDKTGWFEYDNLGVLQKNVSYVVGLHGGIYYLRKGEISRRVLEDARRLIPNYHRFKFKGKFDNPGDEPLVALSMALNHCYPVPFQRKAIYCYWEYVDHMYLDIPAGMAYVKDKPEEKIQLVHWGTRYTRELKYKEQVALLGVMIKGNRVDSKEFLVCKIRWISRIRLNKIMKFLDRIINKIERTIRMG